MADLYTGGGGIVIDALYLVINEGTKDEYLFDLIDIFGDCSLYESLEDSAMSASISVIDGYNIRDNVNLYGGERVVIDFHTAGADTQIIHYTGRLYKIGGEERVNDHTKGYVLYFVSDIFYNSNRQYLNSMYNGTISDIVKSMTPTDFLSGKPLNITPSKGIFKYTFGKERLLDAIAFCSRGAISCQGDTGYMFYEDNKSFNYKPLTDLYKNDPVTEYSYIPSGMEQDVGDRHNVRFNAIQDIRSIEDGDVLARIRDGQHGSTWDYFDIYHKQLYTYYYDKEKQWQADKSLGTKPTKGVMTNTRYSDNTMFAVINDSKSIPLNKYHIGQMSKLEAQTITHKIITYGDSGIKVGDTCLINLPDNQVSDSDGQTSYAGKYLIYAIKHVFNKSSYKQSIEIVKDSYEVH